MTLSVVVIGRNEGARLEHCLGSVRSIVRIIPNEIIYVDSDSSDGSADLAARLGAVVLQLTGKGLSAARARNSGWRAATGDFVLFLDGDTVVDPLFPARALEAISTDLKCGAVYGHLRERFPMQSIYVRVLDLDWITPPGAATTFGGNVLIRKEVLEAVQGYDDSLVAGEDPELSQRILALGWHIRHIDAPMVLHDLAITRFSQYWRRCVRTGYAYAAVADRFRSTANPFWSNEVRQNRSRGLFWIVTLLLAVLATGWWLSIWPVVLWLLLLLAMAARTALEQRWKSTDWSALMLNGLHSHLTHIPVLIGQVQFMVDRRFGRARNSIQFNKDAGN